MADANDYDHGYNSESEDDMPESSEGCPEFADLVDAFQRLIKQDEEFRAAFHRLYMEEQTRSDEPLTLPMEIRVARLCVGFSVAVLNHMEADIG